jgi:glucan-binding repeat-containing protein
LRKLQSAHGGGESGAWGTHGGVTYKEEIINWKISNYTKQALAQYGNIKVYLTRTSQSQYMSLAGRVDRAAALGADLLVSQHINSSESASPKGSSVMISKGTWRPEIAAKERAFGKLVMQELGNLGLYKRFPETGGMEYRMSENGSTYPNGGARDYYGIVARSVEANLPGVIIEHAFISNYSDVMNFLSSDAKLKRVAEADARAIAKYLELDFKEDGWTQSDGNWYYYADGKKKTGWFTVDGDWYYCDSSGARQSGWALNNGKWYYLDPSTGKMLKNELLELGGKTYYLTEDGSRKKGFQWVGGYCYYFTKEDGSAHKGWLKSMNGNWRYMGTSTGRMARNVLFKNKGYYYYVDKNGIMVSNTWAVLNGKKYYFRSNGRAATGWFNVKGKSYLASSEGVVRTDQLYQSPYSGKLCYLNSSGTRTVGWKKVDGKYYYFDSKGLAKKGWVKSSGKWYYLDPKTYVMKTKAWITENKKKYYVNDSGVMVTGLQKISGEWYYFNSSGVRARSWVKLNGKWYYFRPSTGVMLRNFSGKIGNKVYKFNSKGVCLNP